LLYASEFMTDKQRNAHRTRMFMCSLNEESIEIYSEDNKGQVVLETELCYDCYHEQSDSS
jgi:hypothetical protein